MMLAETILSEIESRLDRDDSYRWRLTPDAVFRFEPESVLAAIYISWQRARNRFAIPISGDYDGQAALSEKEATNAGLVSISETGQFKMIRPDAQYLNWQAAFENDHERSFFEYDLYHVIFRCEAGYYHIDQRVAGVRKRFSRLLLPISDAKGEIIEVVTCENHEIEPIVVSTLR